MTGSAAGYDLSVSTFSPDGRLYQIEYVYKAINNNNTALCVECKDGIITCCVNSSLEKDNMVKKNSYNRISHINNNIIITYTGLDGDCRNIVSRARSEANNYLYNFHTNIPLHILANRISLYIHMHTLYWHMRPFASSIIVASFDPQEGGELYCIEPNGACYKYIGVVIGKNKEMIKTELEKKNFKNTTVREAIIDIFKIILTREENVNKEKLLNYINFSWICEESHFEFEHINHDILKESLEKAAEYVEQLNQ